jgi:replication initiation and membrane attachment protein
MKIYLTDSYKIENCYPLDDISIDALYLLYQPLIGSSALNLYMTLLSEGKRMNRFIQPCYFSRLMSILTISLTDLEKYIHILEAIGLLRTYVKSNMDDTLYLFQLHSPLSLKAFFKNQLLQTLLYEALGQTDFDKTKAHFKTMIENKSDYEETTYAFNDVFHVDLKKKQGKILVVEDNYKNKESKDIHLEYDFDMLYNELKNYQIPKSIFSKEDEKVIKEFALVYSIDVLSMVSIIKDSIVKRKLDIDLLKTNVKKFHEIDSASKLSEVYSKQPMQYKINDNDSSELMQHLRYLESITPYDLLKEKQGGKEPVFHDLLIVETLMVQLGLKPGVVNVLIEYVLGTNENRLSRGYCEAIGSSWARKNIVNVKQAYEEAMMNKNEPVIIEDKKEEHVDASHEFDDLLSQLKEGKL